MNNLSEIKSLVNNLLVGWGNSIPEDVRKGLRRIYELAELEPAQPSGQEDLPKTHCVICGQYNHTAIACPDFDHASPR